MRAPVRASTRMRRHAVRLSHRGRHVARRGDLRGRVVACDDPYRHTNPYDPLVPAVSVTVTGPDTVFSFHEVAQFGGVAVPAFPDSAFTIGVPDSIAFPPPVSERSPTPPHRSTPTCVRDGDRRARRHRHIRSAAQRPPRYCPAPDDVSARGDESGRLTQRVVRIQLRCPVHTRATRRRSGGSWSVWADGFDALNQQIVALHSSVANPATGTPVLRRTSSATPLSRPSSRSASAPPP